MQLGFEGSSEFTTTSSTVSGRLAWPVGVPWVPEEGDWVRGRLWRCHVSLRSAEEHGLSVCGVAGGEGCRRRRGQPAHRRMVCVCVWELQIVQGH